MYLHGCVSARPSVSYSEIISVPTFISQFHCFTLITVDRSTVKMCALLVARARAQFNVASTRLVHGFDAAKTVISLP